MKTFSLLALLCSASIPVCAFAGEVDPKVLDYIEKNVRPVMADAVVQSAFRSAGQRCSALRLLCLHEAIADTVIDMLSGAAALLALGEPSELATDVGPLIDREAFEQIAAHVRRLDASARALWPAVPLPGRSAVGDALNACAIQ